MTSDEHKTRTLQVGDRVDIRLHGATRPNSVMATVKDTNPITVAKDQIVVELDKEYQGCENPYMIARSDVNEVIGDTDA